MTGDNLKAVRDRLGFTQQKMAESLGVSRNTVARWERDEIGIPPFLPLALETIERRALKPSPRKKTK